MDKVKWSGQRTEAKQIPIMKPLLTPSGLFSQEKIEKIMSMQKKIKMIRKS